MILHLLRFASRLEAGALVPFTTRGLAMKNWLLPPGLILGAFVWTS